MDCRRFLVALTSTLLITSSASNAEDLWQPYTQMGARHTSHRWLGQGDLILPLMQDQETLLFADLRGFWTDTQAAEGNWGLGYRRLKDDYIIGTYAFFDLRHTEFNNNVL